MAKIQTPTRHKNKYNARPQVGFDGVRYDSKIEREMADILFCLKKAGDIKTYVSKPTKTTFPCGITWKIDFLVIQNDNKQYYLEVKGFATRDYALKLRSYKYHRPLPLFVIGKKNGHWIVKDKVDTGGIDPPAGR